MIVGVDEAGRGPVLGPLVVGSVAVSERADLPDDVDDSKALTAETRERLAGSLQDTAAVETATVSVDPPTIDESEATMNELTRVAQIRVIDAIVADGATVRVDAGDVAADRCGRRIAAGIAADVDVIAEHGADECHAVVGAASVLAKVERDAAMAELATDYGEVGSGYPSDPTTREFLADYVAENEALPSFARESWQTCADVLEAAQQSSIGDF
jgi:ribonuclease HII